MIRPRSSSILIAAIISVTACHFNNSPTTQAEPELVSPKALIRDYRDLSLQRAELLWTDHRIKLQFDSKSYKVENNSVEFFSGFPDSNPILICEIGFNLPDNSKAIEVIGTCKGRVMDNKNRGQGINWFIRVADCSVLVR